MGLMSFDVRGLVRGVGVAMVSGACVLGTGVGVSGCASGGGGAAVDGAGAGGGGGLSGEPIEAGSVVVRVNGLSCPKCANNVERSLLSLGGVEGAAIDMGSGEVTVRFGGKGEHPSEAAIAGAIEEAGFTFVSVRPVEGAGVVSGVVR